MPGTYVDVEDAIMKKTHNFWQFNGHNLVEKNL